MLRHKTTHLTYVTDIIADVLEAAIRRSSGSGILYEYNIISPIVRIYNCAQHTLRNTLEYVQGDVKGSVRW